jgi:hypothetical protein
LQHNKPDDLVNPLPINSTSALLTPPPQWVVIDAKVYDLTKFKALHPGGTGVLLTADVGTPLPLPLSPHESHARAHLSVAGKDATDAFYGLHRHEVLQRPQYARLQIGTLAGATPQLYSLVPGALSAVPYAEPAWLAKGFHSPYYKDVRAAVCQNRRAGPLTGCWAQSHRKLQAALRTFVDEVVYPDAQLHEEDGKRPTQSVLDAMACVRARSSLTPPRPRRV